MIGNVPLRQPSLDVLVLRPFSRPQQHLLNINWW